MPSPQDETIEAAGIGLRIAGAMWRFWSVRGLFTEGREQLGSALAASSSASSLSSTGIAAVPGSGGHADPFASSKSSSLGTAKALNGAGALARMQGDYSSARALLEAALVLEKEVGD